ncbi:hypothetical protein CEXT_601351 [Caerostris extrusa]|uniref:Galectin n=1 Tax=Caerostris extrusa TaxID=172846 RepID=A0AAV4N0Q9_CAEEX|nr:hypothetical protein CEXT_601351 [Caerostris extrusa]
MMSWIDSSVHQQWRNPHHSRYCGKVIRRMDEIRFSINGEYDVSNNSSGHVFIIINGKSVKFDARFEVDE